MVGTPKLTATNGTLFSDGHLYRSITGTLQYVFISCLNITFCVNKLSQYMNALQDTHWQAMKRVLQYLNGILDNGLYFTKGCFELTCYSDAD